MNVSCFQDINILLTFQSSVTLIAVVRERRRTYYNFRILLLCSKYIFLNNKSLNQNTRLQVMVVTNVLPQSPLWSLCLTTYRHSPPVLYTALLLFK